MSAAGVTSCPDWFARLSTGRSLVPYAAPNEAFAANAVKVFDRLRLPDVPGQPTLGEAAGDWIRDIVRAIFGSYDAKARTRALSTVFLLVPKKNAKTTYSAGIMLTALLLNERPNAQLALFGPTQEVADLAFQAISGMVEADAELSQILHVQGHTKMVTNRLTKASLKVTTFDPKVATGGKYAAWLLDEMHLLSKVAYASRVIGQIRGARAAINESFGIIISTQSDEPPAGAFRQELDYARGVRDGRITDPGYLPVLFEFPEEWQTREDRPWREPTNWPLVNPNYGRSISLPILIEQHAVAKAKGEEEERRWASQHLNIEIGLALHANRWTGADHWLEAAEPGLDLDGLMRRCEVCTVGIDGGGLDDLLGVYVLGREKGSRRWLGWGHAFADRGLLALRPQIAPQLLDLQRAGELTFVDIGDGANADVEGVADIVERLWQAGLLPEKNGIGLDAVGVAAVMDAIEARGIPTEMMVAVPQGYRLSGDIKGAARKLKDRTMRHCGQRLMAWCVGNARVETRGSAELITKEVSGKSKIDPLIALFNAVNLMSRNPEAANGPSVYESMPMTVIDAGTGVSFV